MDRINPLTAQPITAVCTAPIIASKPPDSPLTAKTPLPPTIQVRESVYDVLETVAANREGGSADEFGSAIIGTVLGAMQGHKGCRDELRRVLDDQDAAEQWLSAQKVH